MPVIKPSGWETTAQEQDLGTGSAGDHWAVPANTSFFLNYVYTFFFFLKIYFMYLEGKK